MATYQTIYVDRGASLDKKVPVKNKNGLPVDITGFLARGQIRKHWSSKNSVSFITNIPDPTTGIIYINLTSEQTACLKPGRFVFDLELYDDTQNPVQVIRVLEGQIVVTPRVTKGAEELSLCNTETPEFENLEDDGWFYEN